MESRRFVQEQMQMLALTGTTAEVTQMPEGYTDVELGAYWDAARALFTACGEELTRRGQRPALKLAAVSLVDARKSLWLIPEA